MKNFFRAAAKGVAQGAEFGVRAAVPGGDVAMDIAKAGYRTQPPTQPQPQGTDAPPPEPAASPAFLPPQPQPQQEQGRPLAPLEIEMNRFYFGVATIGLLRITGYPDVAPVQCFTLEDQLRMGEKVAGETCIPAGRYQLKLRTIGGLHTHYSSKFSWHQGMIELCDVPDFTGILIHIGNEPGDTAGCLLVGDMFTFTSDRVIGSSATAYERIYEPISAALVAGAGANLTIYDGIAGAEQQQAPEPVAEVGDTQGQLSDLDLRMRAIEEFLEAQNG